MCHDDAQPFPAVSARPPYRRGPVAGGRLTSLGLGKGDRALEKAGLLPEGPAAGQVRDRLAALRRHPWSSCLAYAGHAAKPSWLTCDRLWWRAGQEKGADRKADYRRYVEE